MTEWKPQRDYLAGLTDAAVRANLTRIVAEARRTLERAGLPATPQLLSLEKWLASTINRDSADVPKEGEAGK